MKARRHLFRLATVLSLVACASLISLYLLGRARDSRPLKLPGTAGVQVKRGELCIFNCDRSNRQAVILYTSPHALPATRETELDLGGLYFRLMFLQEAWWWTLTVPLGYPIGLTLVLPTLALVRWDRRRARKNSRRCSECGYDVSKSLERCPECGFKIVVRIAPEDKLAEASGPRANVLR